jgi:hypothetical protein
MVATAPAGVVSLANRFPSSLRISGCDGLQLGM